MLRNQATNLLRHEHLTTTVPKAKELRPFVERIITIAKRGLAAGPANARELNARRLVMHDLQDRDVVAKLFDTIAPRFADRPGGYTRIIKIGTRPGDSAEMAYIELVDDEYVATQREERTPEPVAEQPDVVPEIPVEAAEELPETEEELVEDPEAAADVLATEEEAPAEDAEAEPAAEADAPAARDDVEGDEPAASDEKKS